MAAGASINDKQPLLKDKTPMLNYTKRYDQVSWRSADTDFEVDPSASSADEFNRPKVKSSFSILCTKRRRKFIALVIVIVVFLAIMSGLIYLYYAKPAAVTFEETDSVSTDGGLVKGVVENVVVNGKSIQSYSFKGLPYALPPVKNLRFKPSVPISKEKNNSWKGIYKAFNYGSSCVQLLPDNNVGGSEDCLYLNVYTPSLNKNANLPVFVWIHGGHLTEGNGNTMGYSPDTEFATSMDVVAVSMNYRLNAFGFLTLKELWDDGKSYGNYGIMDQILVLKWIKNNIKNFGGNPDSVTLVGQGSGGTSIVGLLAAPLADRFFNNAISMSGSPNIQSSYLESSLDNLAFLKNSQCRNVSTIDIKQCLLNLTISEITNSIPYDVYPNWAMKDIDEFPQKHKFYGGLIVLDPVVIITSPNNISTIKFNTKNRVSVLLGSTAQEIGGVSNKKFSTLNGLKLLLKKRLDEFSPTLYTEFVKLYQDLFNSSNNFTTEYIYQTITSDVRMNCPTSSLVHDFSKSKKHNVFQYIVTNTPSKPVTISGIPLKYSFGMWDSIALFNFKYVPNHNPSQTDLLFKKSLQDNFKHFMKFGHLLETEWQRNRIGDFNNKGTVGILTGDYHTEECQFWNKYLADYAWVN